MVGLKKKSGAQSDVSNFLKPKNVQYTMMKDQERRQILTFDNLEPSNAGLFCSRSDIN